MPSVINKSSNPSLPLLPSQILFSTLISSLGPNSYNKSSRHNSKEPSKKIMEIRLLSVKQSFAVDLAKSFAVRVLIAQNSVQI